MIAWFAYLQASPGLVVPHLRDELGLSYLVGGLHVAAFSAGAMLAGTTSSWLERGLGRNRLLWSGAAILGAGAIALTAGHTVEQTITAALLMGIGGGAGAGDGAGQPGRPPRPPSYGRADRGERGRQRRLPPAHRHVLGDGRPRRGLARGDPGLAAGAGRGLVEPSRVHVRRPCVHGVEPGSSARCLLGGSDGPASARRPPSGASPPGAPASSRTSSTCRPMPPCR